MPYRNPIFFMLVLSALPTLFAAIASADPPESHAVGNLRDDAALQDVQWIGSRRAWSVGDHGTCLRTEDGGDNWQIIDLPTTASLRDVCALTDRDLWIAGAESVPFGRFRRGVLLVTDDGGESWKQPSEVPLPALHRVRFFDRKIGIVVGEPSPEFPSGVLKTDDGGATWTQVADGPTGSWRAADFVHPEVGMVAGQNAKMAMFGGQRLLRATVNLQSLKTIHEISLDADDRGWLAGDGGLLMRTSTGGVVWETVDTGVSESSTELFDFHSVSHRGNHVWVVGAPGTVIRHSADQGATWNPQPSGTTLPLNAVHFRSETDGLAVGHCGQILRTRDGGEIWTVVRGGGRRAALMTVQLHDEQTPFGLLARYALDEGFRTVGLTIGRADAIASAGETEAEDERFADATLPLGVNSAPQWWRLPVVLPDLQSDAEGLWREWNRWTEGRVDEILIGGLVREIRIWRPDVVVLPHAPKEDAATELLNRAVREAVVAAADSTRFIDHNRTGGLGVWKVKKIFRRLPSGSNGQIRIGQDDWLPHARTSVRAAVAATNSLLPGDLGTADETFRLVWDGRTDNFSHPADPFAGLWHPPNSEARRAVMEPIDEDGRAAIAQRIRHFNGYASQVVNDARQSLGWLAQLEEILRGLDKQWAAVELAHLADVHRQEGHWEQAEQAYMELVTRYPDQPAAREGMTWLLALWTGNEPTWRRRRERGTRQETVKFDRSRVEQASRKALDGTGKTEGVPNPFGIVRQVGSLTEAEGNETHTAMVSRWHDQAARLTEIIEREAPELFLRPEVQFPLAALRRHRGSYGKADEIYRAAHKATEETAWKHLAAGELWLAHPISLPPRPVAACISAAQRPHLDGLLSDECWQLAKPVTLDDETEQTGGASIVMFCHDEMFLYVGASLRRDPRVAPVEIEDAGRDHDADQTGHDRLRLLIDTDRDYTTAYELTIDHRGQTADVCWNDMRWNPNWYVSVAGEPDTWRIEAAIPFSELIDRAPRRGHAWAVGVERLLPLVGRRHWPPGLSTREMTTLNAGLLKFE